jgi:hypothetical protein
MKTLLLSLLKLPFLAMTFLLEPSYQNLNLNLNQKKKTISLSSNTPSSNELNNEIDQVLKENPNKLLLMLLMILNLEP